MKKCAMLVMKKGKIVKAFGMELPDVKVIAIPSRWNSQISQNIRDR